MRTFPTILKSIARVAHLHGQQGLALCDHRESIYGYENKAKNDREGDNVSRKRSENLW